VKKKKLEENRFVQDQKVGLVKEVKLLEKDGDVKDQNITGVPYPKIL
jgi:hypothetical protein